MDSVQISFASFSVLFLNIDLYEKRIIDRSNSWKMLKIYINEYFYTYILRQNKILYLYLCFTCAFISICVTNDLIFIFISI